ncbi:MAG: IclR family transcriptional regulator [Thermomicrobiales bacterium]|nr:IclR family transcriptional regulator [Thermomicrobiales bacterium]
MDIIEALASKNRGFRLSELAEQLGLNESTAHHLLATLKERGFVRQDPKTRAYHLGFRLASLINGHLAESDIYTTGIDAIRALRDASGETTYLTLLDGMRTHTLIELLGNRAIQARRPSISGDAQFHCTASGKTFLSWMAPGDIATILPTLHLERFTHNTIVELDALTAELTAIRRQGYALDREENLVGIACVAAPIFDREGACIATASVAHPVNSPAAEEYIGLVVAAANEISANLGHMLIPRTESEPSSRSIT